MTAWTGYLNHTVLAEHNTRITGGFDEPFYRAPVNGMPAEIRYTRDYVRSALHELGHWCVAGSLRRRQDDYGYWYTQDGRTDEQQQLFFHVEIKPQAIEKHFCTALSLPFEVSIDNLGNQVLDGINEFRSAVDAQYYDYAATGLPDRAASIHARLREWRKY